MQKNKNITCCHTELYLFLFPYIFPLLSSLGSHTSPGIDRKVLFLLGCVHVLAVGSALRFTKGYLTWSQNQTEVEVLVMCTEIDWCSMTLVSHWWFVIMQIETCHNWAALQVKSPAKLDLSFRNGLDLGLREIALSALSHVTNCISRWYWKIFTTVYFTTQQFAEYIEVSLENFSLEIHFTWRCTRKNLGFLNDSDKKVLPSWAKLTLSASFLRGVQGKDIAELRDYQLLLQHFIHSFITTASRNELTEDNVISVR